MNEVVDPNVPSQGAISEQPPAPKAPGAVGIGIIGAGVISGQYLGSFHQFADVDVRFIADKEVERARSRAEEYGIRTPEGDLAAGTVTELLAREDIEIVVNLTQPAVHAQVDLQILRAGKHVWSEKPIALDANSSYELLDAAASAGLRLACAPDTMLGAGMQNALRAIARGDIGDPLTASLVFQTSGPESWHPSPEFLFAEGAGPLFDMGPYYLTAAVRAFGPVTDVVAVSSTSRQTRVIGSGPKAGTEFPVEVPTYHAALLTFAGGQSAQATFSFQNALERPGVVEISGTEGTIVLPDPNMFDGSSQLWTLGEEEPRELPATGAAYARGTGVVDLARSIRADRPEQAPGALAAHVLDVMLAIRDAAQSRRVISLDASVEVPPTLPEDWDPSAATL